MSGKNSSTQKEPWLAVVLSSIFPGFGQFYAGQLWSGLILILIGFGLILGSGWLILGPTDKVVLGYQFVIGYFLVLICNLFLANFFTKKNNSSEFEKTRRKEKDPWLGVFLSRIIPGLGHLYIKHLSGFFFFISIIFGYQILSSLLSRPLYLDLGSIVLFSFCFYHVYISTPNRRVKSKQLIISTCLFIIVFDFFLTLILYISANFIVEARYIPAEGMKPTLQKNDRVLIDKLGYSYNSLERKDIVIFTPTPELKKQDYNDPFIKRIIGLPGETIEIKNGKVYINNDPLKEEYTLEPPEYKLGPVDIPSDSYFVLGDNRSNSYDSRYWGFLKENYIFGKVIKIFWPLERIKLLN